MLRLLWILLLLPTASCFLPRDEVASRVVDDDSDRARILQGGELTTLLVGNVVTLPDGSGDANVTYGRDGSYQHVNGSSMSQGRYRIAGDQVCVTFTSGNMRCDRYAASGGNFVFLTETGIQTPVRSIRPIG